MRREIRKGRIKEEKGRSEVLRRELRFDGDSAIISDQIK
jgi:hypothetical protein